jgi:hypothetical protein
MSVAMQNSPDRETMKTGSSWVILTGNGSLDKVGIYLVPQARGNQGNRRQFFFPRFKERKMN